MVTGSTSRSARLDAWLWLLQRASAVALAVCVVVHLATILYAMRGGLSAAEILSRTRGSLVFGAFYALFVAAVSIHAPIGLRAVLAEWAGLRSRTVDALLAVFAAVLLAAGSAAIRGVVSAP